MSCCVSAHALLSALVARLASGGTDVTEKELVAVIGSGCPRADVERALARSDLPAFARARATLSHIAE